MGREVSKLLFWTSFINICTASEHNKSALQVYLSAEFLSQPSDFNSYPINGVYFPLEKSYELSKESGRGGFEVEYSSLQNEAAKRALLFRGFRPYNSSTDNLVGPFMQLTEHLLKEGTKGWQDHLKQVFTLEVFYSLPFSLKNMLPFDIGAQLLTPEALAAYLNAQPTNIAYLHKSGLDTFNKWDDSEKNAFVEALDMPELSSEIGYILAYRWNISQAQDRNGEFSMKSLALLPAEAVLGISQEYFKQYSLSTKLLDAVELKTVSEKSKLAWYKLASRYMDEEVLIEKFAEYKHILLAAPLKQMLVYMKDLDNAAKIQLLTSHQLIPVKVQEIWKTIDKAASDEISDDFFTIGHNLDIAQIDYFYRNEFAHLHFQRHELESRWVDSDVDVPWPIVKYIARQHRPRSDDLARWTQRELIDMGKFAVELSITDIQRIPSKAFQLNAIPIFTSKKMTNGQLCTIFEKLKKGLIEAGKELDEQDLPSLFYHCISSGELGARKIESTEYITESFIRATKRFSPAQTATLMKTLRLSLWGDDNLKYLAMVLKENIKLLDKVSTVEFGGRIENILAAVLEAGRDSFRIIAENLKGLPRRLQIVWLEKTVVNNGTIDTNLLLDRSDAITKGSAASSSLYTRLSYNKTKLASLVIGGLTCDMMELLPPGEIMDVLAAYRLHIDDGVIPSENRRCFASEVRRYLQLRAALNGVNVTSEIDLLSMLRTGDARAIGAEVLLTWDGEILTKITHPEALYEVMTVISNDAPHRYLHNGVSLGDVRRMAKVFYEMLLEKNGGEVNLETLSRMRDLLPYLDQPIPANSTDIKDFVTAIMPNIAKPLCISLEERKRVRHFILEGFGDPSTWDSLDVVSLGDLLINMNKPDLMKIPVDVFRRALPSLVQSAYAFLLPEIRGYTDPQLYYEACALWLNDGEDKENGEGRAFIAAWESLASVHLSAASLSTPYLAAAQTEGEGGHAHDHAHRRRRQAEGINYRVVHDKVMDLLVERFKDLSLEEKNTAATVITSTQELLGNGTLITLGMDPTRVKLSQAEVLETIGNFKKEGNLDEAKEQRIFELALDAQIRLIQQLTGLMGLTAADLTVTEEAFKTIMDRETFVETQQFVDGATFNFTDAPEAVTEAAGETTEDAAAAVGGKEGNGEVTRDNNSLTTPAPFENGDVDDVLIKDSETLAGLLRPVDISAQFPDGVITTTTELAETMTTIMAQEEFDGVEDLNDVTLTCDCFRTAKLSTAMVRAADLEKMSAADLLNCIEFLGSLHYSEAKKAELWPVLREKINPDGTAIYSGIQMTSFGSLLSEIAKTNPEMLDLSAENIDAVSILGTHTDLLLDRYLERNEVDSLTQLELESLGFMLCRQSPLQWEALWTEEQFSQALPYIGGLGCKSNEQMSGVIYSYLGPYVRLEAEKDSVLNLSSFVSELGWMFGALPATTIRRILPQYFGMVTDVGLRNIPNLDVLESDQLARLSPHTVSLVSSSQFADLEKHKRAALLGAAGEDPVLVSELYQPDDKAPAGNDDAGDDGDEDAGSGSASLHQLVSVALVTIVFAFYLY